MADNFRVLDVMADELQANLNAIDEPWLILHWDFYDRIVETPCPLCGGEDSSCSSRSTPKAERRVTVVMMKVSPATVPLAPGFDPRILRRN